MTLLNLVPLVQELEDQAYKNRLASPASREIWLKLRNLNELLLEMVAQSVVQSADSEGLSLQVELKVSEAYLADLFATAMEGGINYWCSAVEAKCQIPQKEEEFLSDYIARILSDHPNESFEITFETPDNIVALTSVQQIKNGLLTALLDSVIEPQFDDFDGDGYIADSIIQLALFGELTYA